MREDGFRGMTSNQQDMELDMILAILVTYVFDKCNGLERGGGVTQAKQAILRHLEQETVKAREDSTKWALNRLLEIEKGIRTHDEVKEMFYESLAQLKASTEATKDTK